MNRIITLLISVPLLWCPDNLQAQYTDVLNNNINFEFRVDNNQYAGGNDFDGQADPTIENDFYISDYGWIGWMCYNWDCSSPCTTSGNTNYVWGTGFSFTTEFQITMRAFESDNSNECQFTSGDDHFWNGNATLRDGQIQMPIVYPSTDFRPAQWNPWLASGTGWLFPNTNEWNQIWAETWRYSAGDVSTDPLNFGSIPSGQTKSDINANRSVSVSSSAPLSYTDTFGQSSADAWYSFSVDESSVVTISTDHGETDFDTYLHLFDVGGNIIVSNDDGGSGTTSQITATLCPGSYLFAVEGYSTSTGLFKVSVNASAASALTLTEATNASVSCEGANDGYLEWSASGGVSPYSYAVGGVSIGSQNYTTGAAAGTYEVSATDGCGTTVSNSFSIVNGDINPPNAECVNFIEVSVEEGASVSVQPNQIDDGSFDDCDISSFSLSQTSFDASDAGSNAVTLVVTDTNGNTNQCSSEVIVNVITGIGEYAESRGVSVYPNPNRGYFNVEIKPELVQAGATITVFNSTGKRVLQQAITRNIESIDLNNAAPGLYVVSIRSLNQTITQRMMVD